jgi:spermidine synthase
MMRRPHLRERDATLEPPVAALAAGLFGLSFAAALFTLSIFKLLSFFIMPSLFFDLLFIGFPLGAFIAARWLPAGRASLLQSLWTLQALMAGSVGCCLLAKRFDYLRAHLFDIDLGRLVGQIVVFVGLFLPFFAAYGMSEYLGYQYGRSRLGGRMRVVYALALFGAAAAYIFLRAALPMLGMARVQLIAFVALAASIAVLGGHTIARAAASLEALGLLLAFLVPGLESRFLALYKGHGALSTYDFESNRACRSVYQQWGRYSLCEILVSPTKSEYYGFYNDMFQWEYNRRMGFTSPSLGAIPILQTQPGQSIAIIGAGGGRQVRLAERLGGLSILAIELEPAVFDAVRSPAYLLYAFGRVYEEPGVRPVQAEARGYFERTDERFDLIYLPSVGGYAQMMIEPGNMVRTYEAHRLLRDHLTENGMLAIWYPRTLDAKGVLTDQYVRTLQMLRMPTAAYRNGFEWLILAGVNPAFSPPTTAELAASMRLDATDPALAVYLPDRHKVLTDPLFVPITDEKPYLAGNVRYILSMRQVQILFVMAGGLMALAGCGAWLLLRRRGDPEIPARPYTAVGALSVLIGANFLVVEHTLVIAVFRRLFVYDDALALAAVAFLGLSGLGSLIGPMVAKRWLFLASAIGMGALFLGDHRLPIPGVLLAVAPVAVTTGTFFPALFNRAAENPLGVFGLDAIGAGAGAVLVTFVPIIWGFSVLYSIAVVLFAVTAAVDRWFHHGLHSGYPEATARSDHSILAY